MYIVGSIIFILTPRFIIYKQIKKGKNKLLNEIYDEFQKIPLNVENLQKQKDKIQELNILYTVTDKFSPLFFDIKYLRLYFSSLPLSTIGGFLFKPFFAQLQEIIKNSVSQ